MNILFISTGSKIGGSEISLYELVCEMKQTGRFTITVALPNNFDSQFKLLYDRCGIKTIKYYPFRWVWPKSRNQFFSTLLFLKSMLKSGWPFLNVINLCIKIVRLRIDIVHTNNSLSLDGAVAALITRRKHILHIREIFGKSPAAIIRYPFDSSPKVFRKVLSCLSSKIVLNSCYLHSQISELLPIKKSTVIYNIVKGYKRELPTSKRGMFTIGLVANVNLALKNQTLFIRMVSNYKKKYGLNNVYFKIYGHFSEGNNNYMKLGKIIEEFGLDREIIFCGYKEPHILYSEVDILVHTYPFETFGRTVAEAILSRIPVIALKGGGVSEISEITKGSIFLFDEKNLEDATDYAHQLVSKEGEHEAITEKAFNCLSKELDASKIIYELEHCYNALK